MYKVCIGKKGQYILCGEHWQANAFFQYDLYHVPHGEGK